MNKKYKLFLDTAQDRCNIALFNEDRLIDKYIEKTHNNMTDIVVERINALLEKNGTNKHDIEAMYITNGPGSFTGCRVAVIIAKT